MTVSVRSSVRRLSDGRGLAPTALSSILLRGLGITTTLVAVPLALSALGAKKFSAFLLLFSIANWMNLSNLGVQSALGQIVASRNTGTEERRQLLGASLLYTAITGAIFAIGVVFVFDAWAPATAARLGISARELLLSGYTLTFLLLAQMIFQVFEGLQIGEQKIYVANLFRLIGSSLVFGAVIIVPRLTTNLSAMVLAMNGGLVIAAALNAGHLSRTVSPSFENIRANIGKIGEIAGRGLAFFVIGIASVAQTNIPLLILSFISGPESTTEFALYIRLLFTQMMGLAVITGPLWPALAKARAEGDAVWIRRYAPISGALVCGAGIVSLVVLSVAGGPLIDLWTRHHFAHSRLFQVLFGVYFFQMAWSHFWATILIGLRREVTVAVVLIVEAALIVALGTLFAAHGAAEGMALGMTLSLAVCSNWLFPSLAVRSLRHLWLRPKEA